MASLTLELAERVLGGCKESIAQSGYRMCVAVTDERGDPVAMVRTDGASWRTPDIARGKAVAAACMGKRTGELEHRANDPIFLPFTMMQGGNFILGRGAVPIYVEGELVGAVGVSGGTPEQDEEIAIAGVEYAGASSEA